MLEAGFQANPLRDFKAVESWQTDLEQHPIRATGNCRSDGVGAVVRHPDPVA